MSRTIPGLKRPGMCLSDWRNEATGYLFASPWLLGFLLFTIYPLAAAFYYSLTRYDLLRPAVWTGLANYRELFTTDLTFRLVMGNTLFWVVLSAPLGVISAFFMAYMLNTRIIGRSLFRAIFFLSLHSAGSRHGDGMAVSPQCTIWSNRRHAADPPSPGHTIPLQSGMGEAQSDSDPYMGAGNSYGHFSGHIAGCPTLAL